MTKYEKEFHILLTRKEAAEFLGVKENTLAVWLTTRRYDLPVVKVGRLCKYRKSDLLDFLDKQTTPGK
ncbi:helix-turn-helix domain-containing protein [Rickettsiales bacterium]|nr:helix-turn-helix domain-containing protein [Rickettsiales bacterium]